MVTSGGNDEYQQRYLAHQARKKDVLIQLLEERHSERMFSDESVPENFLIDFVNLVDLAPSSCDRHGIIVTTETARDRKALLGGLLVGGVGWIHRAPAIFLFWGDPQAYKAGDEWKWNPYLDTGMLAHSMFLYGVSIGMKCCFVNPQVRDFNQQHFQQTFSPMLGPESDDLSPSGIYCGALAIGWPRESRDSDSNT